MQSPQAESEIKLSKEKQRSVLENLNLTETIAALKQDGFSLGINLHQEVIQEIWDVAMRTPCYANSDSQLSFYYPEKKQAQAKYGTPFIIGRYDNIALACPAIKKLETDPILLEIARQYLQAEPVYQGNQLWWNFPVESSLYERRLEVQMFYCDRLCRCASRNRKNSHFLRFSFYITDVDLCSSPHVCVRGSHINKKCSQIHLSKGCSYQEITKYYDYKNIVPICGKAGSGFVEDTRCFHKATPPGSKQRLTLQITFSHR